MLPTPAAAQAESDPWIGVEEMIVTGSGGSAVLLEAPTSVAAFDKDYLEAIGAQNIGDIAEFTPNLEINSPFAASNPQLFIRGVGLQDSNSNATSAVAVVADGVYLSSPASQLSQLFDVKSLEVLRGPQGALYGRNASAGVIRLTSNPPVHEYDAAVNVTYGRFNQAELDGFLNVPVVPDLIAARFSFKYARRDHLGENRCARFRDTIEPSGPLGGLGSTKCRAGIVADPMGGLFPNSPRPTPPSNVNNRHNWAARTLWLFEPTDALDLTFNFHGGQNLGKSPSFQNRGLALVTNRNGVVLPVTTDKERYLDPDTCTNFTNPRRGVPECNRNDARPGQGSPYSGDYSLVGDERITLLGSSLSADWSDGPWSFEGVVAWEFNDREAVLDIDSSPFVKAETFFDDTATEYFADARLTWDDAEGIAVTLGGTALYDRLGATNLIWIEPGQRLQQVITQKTYHGALFGYLVWGVTESLTLEGGARINYERKNFELTSRTNRFINDVPVTDTNPLSNERELAEEFRPSGEIILRYEPTADLKYYWRFSRGYKGRHFNGTTVDENTGIDPVEAEFVNSFELGFSMSFFDGSLNWNGAAFYYDYENQQVFNLQDDKEGGEGAPFPVNQLLNAEDSRLIGGETDVRIAWRGLEIFQSVGVQYSEFSDFRTVNEQLDFGQSGGGAPGDLNGDGIVDERDLRFNFRAKDFSGNQLVNSPELSYVGYVLYAHELVGIGTITPRLDYRYKSRVFFTPENDSRAGSPPRWILDARITYANPSATLTVSAWVRNLTDELYPVTALDRKDANQVIAYVISDPRTYGVSASFRF